MYGKIGIPQDLVLNFSQSNEQPRLKPKKIALGLLKKCFTNYQLNNKQVFTDFIIFET